MDGTTVFDGSADAGDGVGNAGLLNACGGEGVWVSVASVVKWSQRQRRTGSVSPGKMGGHCRPLLLAQWPDWNAGSMS